MSLSTKLNAIASKLINKFGTPLTLTTYVDGGYNIATATNAKVATSVSLMGLVEEYAERIRFLGNKLEVGTQIIAGDKKLTIAANDVKTVPKAGNQVTVLGDTYNITGIASAISGEGIALYVLHIRKV